MPQIPYFDNLECLWLLQNQPGRLIHIMDDQARHTLKKMDHTMVEVFAGFPTFTINHFNGPVTDSAKGFVDQDLDSLNPDFVSLL